MEKKKQQVQTAVMVGMELLALIKALTKAGVITEDQLREAREEVRKEGEAGLALLHSMLQANLKPRSD